MPDDHIWDGKDHVAWIRNGEVFSVRTKQKIASLRGRQLYSLDGRPLNLYLRDAGIVDDSGVSTPDAFKKLVGM
jgi:hypothetical protein